MAANSVFIGLVSHSKSSFSQSQGHSGLCARLAQSFSDLGVESQVQVNTANLFDEEEFALTGAMARASVREEIRLESAWFRFLRRPDRVSQSLRLLGRWFRFWLDWRSNSRTEELRRLLNIEYSHADLYRKGAESGCDWVIILEDDAFTKDPEGLASGLVGVFESSGVPKMINLSISFSLSEIGVAHLLSPVADQRWTGSTSRVLFASALPATNTVCAIVYRADFMNDIITDFDSQPLGPVVPIDWKLNASLMRLWASGSIGAGECWFIEPGPILQISMHHDHVLK
jgi:hypothetical protein